MPCKNCDPLKSDQYKTIKITPTLDLCLDCGTSTSSNHFWDTYFHSICVAVPSKSPCLSRKIGAVLVRDHSIVATGYNGPSRGIPHCGHERFLKDSTLAKEFNMKSFHPSRMNKECPRRILGYESGIHMELCPAQHAEVNAISNAARLGVSVLGSILYMNCVIPCKNCFGALINSGVAEIVVDDTKVYDNHTQYLINNSTIKIRRFEL